jgi:hypothetical protein
MIEDPWETFVSKLKAEVWGVLSSEAVDDLYAWKYTGEKVDHPRTLDSAGYIEYMIREDYTTERYLAQRLAGIPKTSSAVTRRGQQLRSTRNQSNDPNRQRAPR